MSWITRKHRIGEVLVSLGLISADELGLALATQRGNREKLGEILVRLGLIDRAQLLAGLMEQYRRWMAGAVGMSMLLLQNGALAGSSGTIALSGVVPPRAAMRLVTGPPVPTVNLQHPVANALLTRIFEETAAQSGYSLELVSQSAGVTGGQPRLVAADGTTAIPYKLSFAGHELHFNGPVATLDTVAGGRVAGHSGALTISTMGSAAPTGRYQDTLSLVIRAH